MTEREQEITQELENLRLLQTLGEYSGEDRVLPAQEVLAELASDKTPNISSGIGELDEIIGGFRRGQLVVISAATGQGKTTFAQFLTVKMAEAGNPSTWFSYEVGVQEFMEKMGQTNFYMPRKIKQSSMQWLELRILEGIAKYGSRVVFIDHLHYLLEMEKMANAKSISLLIGQTMRDLKRLAVDRDVLIFVISHVRKTETEKDPELEDLRDSSFTAQESDVVIMLKRLREKDAYGSVHFENTTKLLVRKNRRTGTLGGIQMAYDPTNKSFFIDKAPSAVDIPVTGKSRTRKGGHTTNPYSEENGRIFE